MLSSKLPQGSVFNFKNLKLWRTMILALVIFSSFWSWGMKVNIYPDPNDIAGTSPRVGNFQTSNDSFRITFYKFPVQSDDPIQNPPVWGFDRRVYRSLVVFGVKTDSFDTTYMVNYDQAYFNVTLNLTNGSPAASPGSWVTSIRARVVNYDSWAKDDILNNELQGLELFSRLKNLGDLGVATHYSEHYSESNTLNFTVSHVRMTTYLVVVDILLLPVEENKNLYTTWAPEIAGAMGCNFSGGLHYELVPDTTGDAFLLADLMPVAGEGDDGSRWIIFIVLGFIATIVGPLIVVKYARNTISKSKYFKGVDFVKKGDFQNAAVAFTAAVKSNPRYFEAWDNLGISQVQMGQVAQAVASFKTAAKIKPNSEAVWNNLGLALRAMGNKIGADFAFQTRDRIKNFKHPPPLSATLKDTTLNLNDADRLERLKKLVQVSRRMRVDQMAAALGMKREDLLRHIIDWAATLSFKIDGDEIDFEGGQKEAFIAALENEFASWSEDGKAKT